MTTQTRSFSFSTGRYSTSTALPHVEVGCVPVFAGRAHEAIGECLRRIESGTGGAVATANLDFLAIARSDEQARALLRQQDMVVADGMPVAWLARLRGASTVERLSGVDLVDGLLREAGQALRVFLYGSTPEVSAAAAQAMCERYPGVNVVGAISPPFRVLSESELAADVATIEEARPNLVLVALGFPRQEQFIELARKAAPGAVWIGIGGTLDFYAGRRVRAPRLLQRLGAEWLVRLVQEPRRLWRRYLLRDLPEAARCARECLSARWRGERYEQPLN